MTFNQQMLASLLGAFLGFASALIVFFLTYYIRNYLSKRTLRRHLKREFEYNLSLIRDWIEEIEKILRKISSSDKKVYSYLQYSYFQRYFIQEAFKLGIMYNLLSNEELSKLNNSLIHCSLAGEQYINSIVSQWKSGKIEQSDALGRFEFEKEQLQQHKKHLGKLLTLFNKRPTSRSS